MQLDRYSTGIPRFLVYRHQPEEQAGVCTASPILDVIQDGSGNIYREVDPWECFVLKRRDKYSLFALFGYITAAWINRDHETSKHVRRLAADWQELTQRQDDAKTPD